MSRLLVLADFGQDWNLVGWPVWLSLVTGIVGAWATSGYKRPERSIQLRLKLLLPAITFGLCLIISFKNWPVYYYKIHYAVLDVAFLINFAFGVGFTLDALRTRERFVRIGGICCALALFWLFSQAVQFAGK